jgi:hypothetical protein
MTEKVSEELRARVAEWLGLVEPARVEAKAREVAYRTCQALTDATGPAVPQIHRERWTPGKEELPGIHFNSYAFTLSLQVLAEQAAAAVDTARIYWRGLGYSLFDDGALRCSASPGKGHWTLVIAAENDSLHVTVDSGYLPTAFDPIASHAR